MAELTKYGVARHFYLVIVKRAVVDFAVSADWTPAAGDVKISIDGGAAANVTNLPTAIAMGNTAIWDFSMTSGEMTGKQMVITVADSATKAVEDQSIRVETYGNASAQHAFDLNTATVVASSVTAVGTGAIVAGSFGASAIDSSAIAATGASKIRDSVIAYLTGRQATAAGGGASTITLDASAVATDSYYLGYDVLIVGGTGIGQTRLITAYVGSTKVATVDTAWTVNPDNTSVFALTPNRALVAKMLIDTVDANALKTDAVTEMQTGLATSTAVSSVQTDTTSILTKLPTALVGGRMDSSVGAMAAGTLTAAAIATDTGLKIRSGTAQAGASTTITLDSGASATDSLYVGAVVVITGGTGAGQHRIVTTYVGSTKVVTVGEAWQTNPDNTSTFMLLPGRAFVSTVLAAAITAIQSGLATSTALATAQTSLNTIAGYVDTEVADIVARVTDLQARTPASLVSGRMDSSIGAMAADVLTAAAIATDALGSLELASGAATEVATAVWAQAMSELSGVPAPTDSVLAGIEWLVALNRNLRTQGTTTETVYKDDGTTVLATSTKTDTAGTFSRGEYT